MVAAIRLCGERLTVTIGQTAAFSRIAVPDFDSLDELWPNLGGNVSV